VKTVAQQAFSRLYCGKSALPFLEFDLGFKDIEQR
jgi:hypothetical protein